MARLCNVMNCIKNSLDLLDQIFQVMMINSFFILFKSFDWTVNKERNKSLSWTMDVESFLLDQLHLNAPWFSKLNNYFERKCLQHCDRITLNTVSLKDLYINYYGINEKKIYCPSYDGLST